MVAGVREAADTDSPLDAVAPGLEAAASMLGEGRRDLARKRLSVIADSPELREREYTKLADYSASVAAVLRERGVHEPQATMAADAGMVVLRVALQRWANDRADGPDLAAVMRTVMQELRALT